MKTYSNNALKGLIVIILTLASPIASATLIKATAAGTIYNSEDLSNILGYSGASDGQRVTFHFNYDTESAPPDFYGGARFPREADYFTNGNNITAPSWVSSYIVFDNGTTFRSSDYFGDAGTTDQVKIIEKDGGSPYDYIGFFDAKRDDSGRAFTFGAVVYDYVQNVVNGLAIDQYVNWTLGDITPPNVPKGRFAAIDNNAGWSFQGEVALDTLTVTKVPESGTLILFCLGLAGLGFSRRRRV